MISYQISQLRVPGAGMRLQPGRRLNKTAVMTFVSCQCVSERRKAFGCKMGCQEARRSSGTETKMIEALNNQHEQTRWFSADTNFVTSAAETEVSDAAR